MERIIVLLLGASLAMCTTLPEADPAQIQFFNHTEQIIACYINDVCAGLVLPDSVLIVSVNPGVMVVSAWVNGKWYHPTRCELGAGKYTAIHLLPNQAFDFLYYESNV